MQALDTPFGSCLHYMSLGAAGAKHCVLSPPELPADAVHLINSCRRSYNSLLLNNIISYTWVLGFLHL